LDWSTFTRYDPGKFETRFSTYATPWIKSALGEGVRRQQSLVVVPQRKNSLMMVR
jgi:DNA-directed RNA polymerase sigma subunit (sigma70/sigma32)